MNPSKKEKSQTILLVPLGRVPEEVLEFLQSELPGTFQRRIAAGPEIPIPPHSFNQRRNQFFSTALLDFLIKRKEYSDYDRVLGLVDQDLYVPELNFVFGEAMERVAVISLTRLRQGFYGLPEDPDLFRQRVLTEAVHELGHTYRLGHCRNSRCVMFFSNRLTDTDLKGSRFCPICKRQLGDIHRPLD